MAKKTLTISREDAIEEIKEQLEDTNGFQDFATTHSDDDEDFKEMVIEQLEDMDDDDLEEAYRDNVETDAIDTIEFEDED